MRNIVKLKVCEHMTLWPTNFQRKGVFHNECKKHMEEPEKTKLKDKVNQS